MDNTTIAVIVGFVFQAVRWERQQVVQRKREERQRKWDVEDRLAIATTLAKHTTATAATLAEHTTATAAKVAEALAVKTTEQSDKLEAAISDNTKISMDAFHEANTVNLKLEKLGAEHNALDRLGLATEIGKKE